MFYQGPPGTMVDLSQPSVNGADVLYDHAYVYVRNNPTSYIDPSGESPLNGAEVDAEQYTDCECDPGRGLGPDYPWRSLGPPPVIVVFQPRDGNVRGMPYIKGPLLGKALGVTYPLLGANCKCYPCSWLPTQNASCFAVHCGLLGRPIMVIDVDKVRTTTAVDPLGRRYTLRGVYGHEQLHVRNLHGLLVALATEISPALESVECQLNWIGCEILASRMTDYLNTAVATIAKREGEHLNLEDPKEFFQYEPTGDPPPPAR